MHIVATCSDSYRIPLSVMFTSLLMNKKSDLGINLYVLDGGITSENKEKIKNAVKKFNVSVTFLPILTDLFKGFYTMAYFGLENYYRIMIPQLMDADVEKAIYLDSDIIVRDDITKLWETNIDNYYIAAVEDPSGLPRCDSLSIPRKYGYFNSGVLLFNVKKWKDENLSLKIIQYIRNNMRKVFYMDQDALNANLYNKWLALNPKWNYQTSFLYHPILKNVNPSIIHYTTAYKPWLRGHPLQKEYFYYLEKTDWK